MTRIRTILAVFAVFAAVFQAAPSQAGRTLDIEIRGGIIQPNPLIAQTGDLIRFSVISIGRHHMQSYAATSDTIIDSGQMNYTNQPVVYTTEFRGGTVLYRCLVHSSFDPVNGVCSQMCAVITDETTVPVPPVIDPAVGTIEERPTTITGTAEPLTLVTVTEGRSVEGGTFRGQALTDVNGRWAAKTVDFGSSGGIRPLMARAVRGIGYVSGDSAVVEFPYKPDITPPIITFDGFLSPVFVGELVLTGTASDNIRVRAVAIEFSITSPNQSNPQQISKTFLLSASCDPGCPSKAITWTFRTGVIVGQPAAQVYQVRAVAIDTSEKVTAIDAPTLGSLIVFVNTKAVALPSSIPSTVSSPVASAVPTPSVNLSPVPPTLAPAP